MTAKLIERNTTIPTRKEPDIFSGGRRANQCGDSCASGERKWRRTTRRLGVLIDIPPAPRGVPQIEVTFDIDANGIVHVSAKDLGTGSRSKKVTILYSTSMSKEDIDKAVKDAEQFAEADKKEKEKLETRNNADALVFRTEKTLKDLGDKVGSDDKGKMNAEIAAVKSALAGELRGHKGCCEKLSRRSHTIYSARSISSRTHSRLQAVNRVHRAARSRRRRRTTMLLTPIMRSLTTIKK